MFLLPLVAFTLTFFVRTLFWGGASEPELNEFQYLGLLLFTTVVWAVCAERYKTTSIDELFLERTGIRSAIACALSTYAVVFAGLFFYRSGTFSRLVLACSALFLLLITFFFRAAFRLTLRRLSGNTQALRVLVVGADEFARRAGRRLERGPFPCRIVGFVRLPDQNVTAVDAPVYEMEAIPRLEVDHLIDDIVIALSPSALARMPEVLHRLGKLCIPVRAVIDIGRGMIIRDRLFQFGRLQMLDLANTPAESLDYTLFKRVFDACFSLIALVITAPLMLVVAIAIWLTSAGPILFVQDRVGLNGDIFKIYKFRTMKVSPLQESDTRWTTLDDGRRTGIGKILRKTSIDELPQFFNVLKGDMSVVGPRPERPHFVRKFHSDVAEYNLRHQLKVGITGWAQVNGLRGDTSIQRRLEYDLYYLQNWSISFDVRIIFMTIVGALVSKNAY
jgi:exopolysaccharide biosynthesis polyprenyl glycosylphosphotransferase